MFFSSLHRNPFLFGQSWLFKSQHGRNQNKFSPNHGLKQAVTVCDLFPTVDAQHLKAPSALSDCAGKIICDQGTPASFNIFLTHQCCPRTKQRSAFTWLGGAACRTDYEYQGNRLSHGNKTGSRQTRNPNKKLQHLSSL